DLADTVDYGAVTDTIATTIEREQFTLLERLAQRVAELVLADERIDAVDVTAHKLRPPVPHHLGRSGVRIHRSRSSS
ncbi:MAG: dihydroneopterin aldolase, partial [Acidimicrobiia bacterium]|nr:dihydroneopterin aldolase [Acidimicrobiia bacterium]